jgi:hypothetical protein
VVGGTPQRCISRGIWRTGFHSGGRLRAYALSASRLNTIDSARTLAERIDRTSRSCARHAAGSVASTFILGTGVGKTTLGAGV